jgi:hypothetical protein
MSEETINTPSAALKQLERLVGTWKVTGDARGTIKYEWLEGGFFLMQHVNLELFGHEVKCLEIIGHWRPFGEAPSPEIQSRIYDSNGNTFDYVYELEADTLTIWGGERGSPAYYKGVFDETGNTLTGGWVYPGGGGYQATATREP